MIDHLLNSTATVYRATLAPDGRGGRTATWASQGTVRVKVGQATAVETPEAGRHGARLTHVVHAAYGADITRGDELDIGEDRRIRVVAVVTNSRQSYLRADCEVAQGGP